MANKKRERYESLVDNPNVRKALDIISTSENADYNTLFGGDTFNDYKNHPNVKKRFKQKDGKWNSSGAAGRYQMLKSTWDELQSTFGLEDFSPRNQDLGAIALLDRLKGKDGKTALQSAIEGDYQGMVEKAGRTWASFPSAPAAYSQPKHGWNKMNKIIASATGRPLQETATVETSYADPQNGGATHRYNTRIPNPTDAIIDQDYNNLQGELFNFDDVGSRQTNKVEQANGQNDVATVEQSGFIDIPAVYDKAIEDAFGDGSGQQELFSQEIEDSLRGVFNAA